MSPEISRALIQKLQRRDDLSAEECVAIDGLPTEMRDLAEGEALVHEGDVLTWSSLLIEGWAGRIKRKADGGRSITALHMAGDFVDLHSFLLKPMDQTVIALTRCKIAITPHAALLRVTERLPHLSRMLWLSTLIDAAVHREWMAAMGRSDAMSRIARLMCELYRRLELVDLASDMAFRFPLTQTDIADAVGLTPVHVNRSLQSLKKEGLMEWRRSVVNIRDWSGLAALGQFEPAYLNLDKQPR